MVSHMRSAPGLNSLRPQQPVALEHVSSGPLGASVKDITSLAPKASLCQASPSSGSSQAAGQSTCGSCWARTLRAAGVYTQAALPAPDRCLQLPEAALDSPRASQCYVRENGTSTHSECCLPRDKCIWEPEPDCVSGKGSGCPREGSREDHLRTCRASAPQLLSGRL